jgi:predicted nucleic acid-binding protein
VICVDSSVWIAFFRDSGSSEARHLSDLLDSGDAAIPIPVKIEILSGAGRATLDRLREALSAVPTLYPTNHTWQAMDGWITAALRSGWRFGFADLLIAAIAAEQAAELWSLDQDFRRMEKLRFVRLHGYSVSGTS